MSDDISKERTLNYLRQLKGSAVYRSIAVVASFLAVPLMIQYLGQEKYGVWSTLLAILSWLVFFDLGLGHSLRNKVAESLAQGQTNQARDYISTAYGTIGVIALTLWISFFALSYVVSWQTVFNTSAISESRLGSAVRIVAFFVLLNFWVGLIYSLLGALQKSSVVVFGQMCTSIFILAAIFLLNKSGSASIEKLAVIYGFSTFLSSVVLSVWFYRWQPMLQIRFLVDLQKIKTLLTVGFQFFLIQIAGLIMFTTDRILITQLFGPEQVTTYDVVFKIFSIITLVHSLVATPLWSSYTDAYKRGDLDWINKALHNQLAFYGVIVILTCLLLFSATSIIKLWVGDEVKVSSSIIFVMGVFVLVSAWNNIFAMIVNGIGEIRLQLYTAIIAMLVNIPLSIFLAKYTTLGVSAVVVGTICSLLISGLVLPLQVKQLLRSRRMISTH
jgi:O-antigen/teichoic acid export membrane protein